MIIDTDDAIHDTTASKIGVYGDDSHMSIVTSISALSGMADGTTNPFYPGALTSLTDSIQAHLLITAIVDLSLAHNSPVPSNTEQSQGIFTSYMQFMDTVAASWSTVKGQQRGIDRLKAIHNLVLAQNKQHIIDPVSIINRGTSFEQGSREEKRKNYAFYDAFSRLNWDVSRPGYTGEKTGIGVMFRVSANIELYDCWYDGENLFVDSIPFLDGADNQRIILPATSSLLDTLINDSGGVWAISTETAQTPQFYIGAEPVRLPIATINNSIKIDTAFSLIREESATDDPVGEIIFDAEKSVFRIEPVIDENNKTLENVENGNLFLHGQKRKVVYNLDYKEPGSQINFLLIGDTAETKKVIKESETGNSVILHDTSQFNFGSIIVGAVEIGKKEKKEENKGSIWVRLLVRFGRMRLGSYKVLCWDAYDGKLDVAHYVPKKIDGKFVKDPEKARIILADRNEILPRNKQEKKYLLVRWSHPDISIYNDRSTVLFPDESNLFEVKKEDKVLYITLFEIGIK